jgi:hypothetical protein
MKKIALGTLLIALAGSTAAFAQGGAAMGAATGAVGGAIVGGAPGAVGATVGAVAGGIADDSRPRFRTSVTGRGIPRIGMKIISASAPICLRAA